MKESWYLYTKTWPGGRTQPLARPMTATQAERLGGARLEGFDPNSRLAEILKLAGILVTKIPPEGQLESTLPIEAEARSGLLA